MFLLKYCHVYHEKQCFYAYSKAFFFFSELNLEKTILMRCVESSKPYFCLVSESRVLFIPIYSVGLLKNIQKRYITLKGQNPILFSFRITSIVCSAELLKKDTK